jgi:hypothetical protein
MPSGAPAGASTDNDGGGGFNWLACASGVSNQQLDDRAAVPLRPGKKSRVAVGDYFSVVGLHADESKLNAALSKETLRETCGTFIADIIIVRSNSTPPESTPSGYTSCEPAINGYLLCTRRCKESPRTDYITAVEILEKEPAESSGLEFVRPYHGNSGTVPISRSGKKKDLYLVVRRAPAFEPSAAGIENDDSSRFLEFLAHRPAGISSLLVVPTPHGVAPKPRAAPPPCVGNYQLLDKNLGRGGREDIHLAVALGPATGICDLPFLPQTVDRYPAVDHSDFPLPESELPDFCFPHGLNLQHRLTTDAPRPKYFSFVLTSINGERIHVACLCFFEDLPRDLARQLRKRFSYIHRCEDLMPIETVPEGQAEDPRVMAAKAAEQAGKAVAETSAAAAAATAEAGKAVAETSAAAAAATMEASAAAAAFVGSTIVSLVTPQKQANEEESEGDASSPPLSDDEPPNLPRVRSMSDEDSNGIATPAPKRGRGTDSSAPTSRISPEQQKNRVGSTVGEFRLYMPKCICIMSHYPFYRAMRRFLRQLYSISLSSSRIPIERYISFFVTHLPFPSPGGASLHVLLDGSLMESTPRNGRGFASSLPPICLSNPKWNTLPGLDLDFLAPFRCLSVRNVLDIFSLLLLEEQLLFVSSVSSLITEVMETMRNLLFPLAWQGAYVPRLPDSMAGFLDAPGGYMIGMHVETLTTHEELRRQLGIEDGVVVVSLDGGGSLGYGAVIGGTKEDLKPPRKRLPPKPLKDLEKRLQIICKGTGVWPGQDLSYMDSAFEFSTPPSKAASSTTRWEEEEVADQVRDAFLRFMVELFGSFRRYLPPALSLGAALDASAGQDGGAPVLQLDLFDQERFLNDIPAPSRAFLENAVQTQMFSVLASQHMTDYSHDHRMAFFEVCDNEARARPPPKMSAKDIDESNIAEAVLPVPLAQAPAVRQALLSSLPSSMITSSSASQIDIPASTPSGIGDVHRLLSKKADQFGTQAVVVPGPTSNGVPLKAGSFSYSNGWPSPLGSGLLDMPASAIPRDVRQLRKNNTSGQVQGSVLSLVRSPEEASMALNQRPPRGIDLAISMYGIVFIATPTIVACEPHLAVNHVLRALGMLHELQEKQHLRFVDAAMWRALIISCGLLGGFTMREVVVALYTTMIASGVKPTAVNYGQFVKAYQQERGGGVTPSSNYAPPNMYARPSHQKLEDLGWLWCCRQCPSLGGKVRENGPGLESSGQQTSSQNPARSTPGKARAFFSKTRRASGSATVGGSSKQAFAGRTQMTPLLRGWVEYHQPHFFAAREGTSNLFGGSSFTTTFWEDSESTNSESSKHDAKLDEDLRSAQSLRAIHGGSRLSEEASVGIWSESVCPKCQHKTLDEEVMLLWEKQKSSYNDLSIACPQCGASHFPTLNLVELSAPGPLGPLFGMFSIFDDHFKYSSEDGDGASLDDTTLDGQAKNSPNVIYLSPLALRVVLEDLLLAHGDDALNDGWLAQHRPYFRWNIMWFCQRLHLPLPWVISGSVEIDVAIGRDQLFVANAPFYESASRKKTPSLLSLFPGISQDEERTLQLLLQLLNDCPEPVQGIRDSVSQLIGLLTPSIAIRQPYVVLLKLVSTYPLVGMPFIRWPAGDADPTEPIGSEWIPIFDKYFREAVEAVPVSVDRLSDDLNQIGANRLEGRREMADLKGCLGVVPQGNAEPTTPPSTSPPLDGSLATPGADALLLEARTSTETAANDAPRFEMADVGCLGNINSEQKSDSAHFKAPPMMPPTAPNMMPPTPPTLNPPAPPPPSPPPLPSVPAIRQEVRRMSHLAPMPESAMYRGVFGSLLPGDL